MTLLGLEKGFFDVNPLVKFQNNADPVADFTYKQDGDCANEPIKFTNQSTGTELTYLWNFGDGSNSTAKDPSHAFMNAIGNGTQNINVTLTVTDKEGVSKSATKTITVTQIPSLNIYSDQAETTFEDLKYFIICENQEAEFTFHNNERPEENNLEYEIDWGDGSAVFKGDSWDELSHSYDIGIYTMTYSVTPENGCKVSRKYGVFIGSNPSVGLGTPGNTNVCVGEELTFPITVPANNPDGTIYTVNFSDGSDPQIFAHPPPESVSHIFTDGSCGAQGGPNGNYFVVTITAANPCSFSQASVLPIYVSEPVVPEIEVESDIVCVDEVVEIENNTEFTGEVSVNGSCNVNKRFVWEITPATGWTLTQGDLGNMGNPTQPNSWNSGSDFIFPKFTEPGEYTIKLTTGNRCGIGEVTKTITVIPIPEPSFTLDEPEVCGPATVSVTNTSNVLGLLDPEDYTWTVTYSRGECGTSSDWEFASGSNKNTESPTFIFNNPGIYTITQTITASCGTFRESKEILVTSPPEVSLGAIPLTCGPTTFTPTASVLVCGSEPPTYKWTFEGGTPSSSTSLDPGPVEFSTAGDKKIILEVTSACGTTKVEKAFTVANPPDIDLGEDREICKGEETEIIADVTEGSGNYTYTWTSNPTTSISGSTTANILVSPTENTIFSVTVFDNDTQCSSTEQIEITVIPAPTIDFSIPDQEICSGETTQIVSLTSSPPGEIIEWTVDAGAVTGAIEKGTDEIPEQTLINTSGQSINVVYTALIPNSSQGDCTLIPATYTVTVNPEPDYSDEELSICSGETFDFTPNGLVIGSEFTWTVNSPSGISGASNSTGSETSIQQQLENSTNSPIDVIYTVSPTLGNCAGKDFTLKVTVQPSPSIKFSEADQNICTGSDSKEVIISSDVPGATFIWTVDPKGVEGVTTSGNDALIPKQSLVNPTNSPITLEYQVNVETNSGGTCSGIPKIYTITVNPTLEIVGDIPDFNGYQISCFGANDGSIILNPTGGNGVYTYSWTGPNGFTSTNGTIENLAPGTYQVLVNDEFGCSQSKTYVINEPEKLTSGLVSTTQVLCKGDETGSIEIEVAGGIDDQPYTFEWTRNGATFPATSQNLSSIPSGTYEVIITDANGCFNEITGIEITEPEKEIIINYTKTDISCYGANDGSLDLDVSGGLPPYDIRWSFGSTQSGFTNLGPGDYTLTVSDQSGCIRSQTITIEDAALFMVEPEVSNVSCFGANDGSIQLNFQGGMGSTTIRWDHGAELENLFNLSPGFYGATIKDETDCELRSEFNIVEPASLEIDPKITDALDCDNPQSGEIRLGIFGGTPPYDVKWSNGQTVENLTGITSGQYAVTIVDAAGCSLVEAFEVKRPPGIAITSFQSTNVSCEPRLIEEKIDITISGGVAPYTITWSGGNVSPDKRSMTTTEPGLYEVTVVDGKGCLNTKSFNIENNETIADSEIESAAFDQYNAYLVNFEIQFWNRSFGQILSYHWDFGDGVESFEENPKHTYIAEGDYEIVLTVTDVFGCSLEVRKEISVIDYFLAVPNVFTPNGDGINDYFFPRFVGIESLEFWVLNKWGETIFYTDDMESQGWNGKIQNEIPIPGNYVYKLRYKTLDGRVQSKTELFMLLK